MNSLVLKLIEDSLSGSYCLIYLNSAILKIEPYRLSDCNETGNIKQSVVEDIKPELYERSRTLRLS